MVKSADHDVTVLVRTDLTEMVLELQLAVEKEAPHRLTRLGFRPGKAPVAAAGAKQLTADEVVRALDAFVAKRAAADRFSGAVLLAKGDALPQGLRPGQRLLPGAQPP